MSHQDAFVAKLEAQMLEWTAGMERLKAKADDLTADARDACQKQIEEGKVKLAGARQKLDALRAVGSDKWEETKATVESFWKDARAVFEK
jgi:hypothetical protein